MSSGEPLVRAARILRTPIALACAASLLALAPATIGAQEAAPPSAGYPLAVQAQRAAAQRAGVPQNELPRLTVEQLRQRKRTMPAWERKLSSPVRDRLERLVEAGISSREQPQAAPAYATPIVPVDERARLLVEARVDDVGPFDEGYFAALGGQLVSRARGFGLLVAWVPVDQLEGLARRPDVRRIRGTGPDHVDLGSVLTEGDSIHNADRVRSDCGLDGSGQTVGVISDGVDSLGDAQASGDVGVVDVVSNTNGGDEGTGMLEIVADLAPGADLAFHNGHPGSATMILAIANLVASGCTIITDDLPKPREPVFEDGPIAVAKQGAVGVGVFYTASAGNRGSEHHQAVFNGTTSDVTIGPNTYTRPHDFGAGDFQMEATVDATSGEFTFYLQWAEPFGSAGVDLDLYVLDGAGNVLASSTDAQDGDDDPLEVAGTTVASGTVVRVLIDAFSGDTDVFFDLRAFGTDGWEHLVRDGSINGASRQAEVYAAGAVWAGDPALLEGFSSRGPAVQFFPAFVTRLKPDAVAVDGVSITGAGGFGAGTCPAVIPGDCRFFGTSASTPHVAGLAALLLEGYPALTPAEVASTFDDSAVDLGAVGPDDDFGHGRLDVFAALVSLDEVPPVVTCPPDRTVECDGAGNSAELTAWLASASATDNCGVASLTHDFAGLSDGCGATGSALVTWTATDLNGNTASCAATFAIEDSVPPAVTCPDDAIVTCGQSTSPDALGEGTALDTCDGAPVVTWGDSVTSPPCPGDPVQDLIDRTWIAMDECGNSDTCSQAITVLKRVLFLDVKPGSCPNAFNRRLRGVLPVSLVGTPDFDVYEVDPWSLQLSRSDCVGGSVPALAGPLGPHVVWDDTATPYLGAPCGCHDLAADGITDLMAFFNGPALAAALQLEDFERGDTVELTLSGRLLDGCEFIASDCIVIAR